MTNQEEKRVYERQLKARERSDKGIAEAISQENRLYEEYGRKLIESKKSQNNDVRLLEKAFEQDRLVGGGTQREAYKCCNVRGTSLPSLQRGSTEAVKASQAGRLPQNERLGLVW